MLGRPQSAVPAEVPDVAPDQAPVELLLHGFPCPTARHRIPDSVVVQVLGVPNYCIPPFSFTANNQSANFLMKLMKVIMKNTTIIPW